MTHASAFWTSPAIAVVASLSVAISVEYNVFRCSHVLVDQLAIASAFLSACLIAAITHSLMLIGRV